MKNIAQLRTLIDVILPFEIGIDVIQLLIIIGLVLDLHCGALTVDVGSSCAQGDAMMLLMELECTN